MRDGEFKHEQNFIEKNAVQNDPVYNNEMEWAKISLQIRQINRFTKINKIIYDNVRRL